jgi:hypothetical protein
MELFKPKGALQPRRPTDNSQNNGKVVNTPRFSQMGGLDNASKTGKRNGMTMSKPGDTKKVY